MKLILLSDLKTVLSTNKNMIEILKENYGEKRVLFIPSTPKNKNITEENVIKMLHILNYYSISYNSYDILYDIESLKITENNINQYSMIIFMGGDTRQQNKFLHEIQINKILKYYKGYIIGMSAGAINLCEVAFLNKKHDENYPSTFLTGVGLIKNITIDVHFNINDMEQLNELNINKIPVYCIPDTSAIIIDTFPKYINDIYRYSRGYITKIN